MSADGATLSRVVIAIIGTWSRRTADLKKQDVTHDRQDSGVVWTNATTFFKSQRE
jgi:hypothetical protein